MELVRKWVTYQAEDDSYKNTRAIVRVTAAEKAQLDLITIDWDGDLISALMDTAETYPRHYGGPGRPYAHSPSFRITNSNFVIVNQATGLDI